MSWWHPWSRKYKRQAVRNWRHGRTWCKIHKRHHWSFCCTSDVPWKQCQNGRSPCTTGFHFNTKRVHICQKHSLRPLVQISLPPHLCSPVDLKFSKLCLTPQETKEEIGINQCLLRPFHPVLAVLPPKHPTWCLAAIIHTVLHREYFNTKESTSTISKQFQIAPKKLYQGLTEKWYDPGQKLTKAEKAAREAAKVTPSTSSATPSTPSTQETEQQPSTTTEVDPNMSPLEDIRLKKKFRFKDPDSKHFPK